MDYGMISKRDKARRYAEQRGRFHFHSFKVDVAGENNSHTVEYKAGKWSCDCDFFRSRGLCSHTMALEMILEGMLVEETIAA